MKLIVHGSLFAVSLFCSFPAIAAPAVWHKMPLLPPEAKQAGIFPGGEGAQWPRWSIAVSPADPNFLLLPIDVGGLYRSLDGGKNWNISMAGWNARGANAFAIDPRNANHALGIGGNSMDWNADWGKSPNGVYISHDKGAKWQQTLAVPDGLAGQIVYDDSSYSPKAKACLRAYYSAALSGLFRTDDGGATWKLINPIAAQQHNDSYNAALLAVHPKRGTLFIAGKEGLFQSNDHGQTFQRIYDDGSVWGISLSTAAPDKIWISGTKGLLVSSDNGRTFQPLAAQGVTRNPDEPIRQITVGPVDNREMFCWIAGADWKWQRYISHDDGASFQPVRIEAGLAGRDQTKNADWSPADPHAAKGGWAPLPYNVRNGHFTWHPKKANIAWGLGGDWVTKSTDSGSLFRWSNNGYNGVMVGGGFNISPQNPNIVFLGFQDYNGAFTLDGGKTWNYRDISGHGWGGHCYGGYAVNAQVMFYGDAESWGTPRRTRISLDGGQTWKLATDKNGQLCQWSGGDISNSDPTNPNILFASNWRSTDQGRTWEPMSGCDGVYLTSKDGQLWGKKGEAVVESRDGGANWKTLARADGNIDDLAVDSIHNRIFVASQERLKMWEDGVWTTLDTPRDQYGNQKVTTVAIDPVDPQIIYTGGPRNIYASHATIVRSIDGGKTWENLTSGTSVHEVSWIRVHPQTREAWVAGQCYGLWRIEPPKSD